MTSSLDLNTIAGRLATFDGPHHLAKRRASSTKKKTATSVLWPHKTPKPEDLARAGFFYKPTAHSDDSVTCFLCHKTLDGWDADDKPALEHLAHVPDCGWAINICIEHRNQNMDPLEEDPLSDKMVEARRATFQDRWPHENKKGWKCKVQKMVDSGWSYNPLPEADDYVSCFYCGLSLDGWEPKDDPWHEHQRRAPECNFFVLLEEAKAPKAAKMKKAKTSRTSRTSRLSTQANVTLTSDALSPTLPEDLAMDEGHSIMTTTSPMSRSTRQRKAPAKAKAPAKSRAASTSRKASPDTEPMRPEGQGAVTDINAPTFWAGGAEATALRATEPPAEVIDESPHRPIAVTKPPARKKIPKGKKQKDLEVVEGKSQIHELEAEIEAAFASPPQESVRPKRGRKRMSNGNEKLEEPAALVPFASSHVSPQREGPHLVELAPAEEEKITNAIKSDTNTTPRAEIERSTPGVSHYHSPQRQGYTDVVHTNVDEDEDKGNVTVHERTPRPSVRPGQATEIATPPRSIQSSKTVTNLERASLTEHEADSPSGHSAQSSDAENRPPSTRGAFAKTSATQLFSPSKKLFGAQTPTASPSKRQVTAGGLTTSYPWSEVDLSSIFLASPTRQSPSKGNMRVEEVLRSLSSREKQMSIEEWILWNAGKAEEGLRQECERMIGVFEGEGVRALRTLEGLHAP